MHGYLPRKNSISVGIFIIYQYYCSTLFTPTKVSFDMSEFIIATAIGILYINLLIVQLKALENNEKVVVPITLIRFSV